MKKCVKIALLIFIVFFCAARFVFPQTEQYKFRHLTTRQGLPSIVVNSIIKGSKGFMWFATDNGLARYDGYDFHNYFMPGDSVSNSNSQVFTVVFEDNNSNLWVGTAGRGLQRFCRTDETFTPLKHNPDDPNSLSNNEVNTIYQDRKGVLWIGTGNGLNEFNPVNGKFTSFRPDEENPGSPKNKVYALFEDMTGTFWTGTGEGIFLFDREKEIFTRFDFGIEMPKGMYRRVNCITEDKNGILWIGTKWGMLKYNRYNEKITHYLPAGITPSSTDQSATLISNIYVMSIVETGQNGKTVLWIATMWGLNKFDIDSEYFLAIHENPDNPQSLSTSFLNNVYFDEAGLLWIGTRSSGADILNTRSDPFHEVTMKVQNESFSYQPASFYRDNTEILWVGGTEGGIFQFDKHFNLTGKYSLWSIKPDKFDKRHNNRINCIYENNAKTLWLGFYQWGLVLFDKEQKTFRQVELNNHTGVPDPTIIENIIRDQYGILWVGTDAGLYFKNNNEDVVAPAHIIRHDVLNKAEITSLFEDSKNNLWAGTKNGGLFRLKPESRPELQFVQYRDNGRNKNGFWGNYIQSVYEDRNGTLWFGSDKGLNKFNFGNDEFETVAEFNNDYAGHILRIYGDDHDKLWISHVTKGLIRYEPYTGKTNKIKVFDVSDGLPFDNFNTIRSPANSFYQSADGSLFIGAGSFTGHSFFWFRPDSIKDNKHIPPVALTGFNVKGKTFSPDSSITVKKQLMLKYNQNFFSFEFAALDFNNPEKNQYAYYLEGLENEWIYSGNRRFANYTGVPPGHYTFRVKGSNNDGYWNEAGTSFAITILPPPWKTWWAYILYGLAVIAVIYSIIHYYLRRQRLLQTMAIEHIEAEKLKELDSMKSRFFANISHEFRTPLTLIMGPLQKLIGKSRDDEDKQELSLMQRNANRLKELINQLLSISKLEAGKMQLQCSEINLAEWVKMYVQSFESLARQRKIDFVFEAKQPEIKCWFDPEKMAQVLNNLLSNAFKFTGENGKIEVSVCSSPTAPDSYQGATEDFNGVLISISDTGTGIPPDKLQHIFDRFYQADDSQTRKHEGTGIGLTLAKELVELHHGDITVESVEGKGTTFNIFLPLGKDHLKPEEIVSYREVKVFETEQPEETQGTVPMGETLAETGKTDAPVLLIVEDNTDMRKYIAGYFNKKYRIIAAGNGILGLEKAFEHIPDIIISDVMMPGMDGYQMCQKLKTDERTSHIPLILLTARSSGADKIEGLETGADDFVIKPFDGKELQIRVKNLIEQREKLIEYYRKHFEIISKGPEVQVYSIDEKFLLKAKATMEKNLSNPEYGVESFASGMALSRFQLHRKLSALVNQSTTEFIRTIRLNFAAGLLKKRAGTISEIAYDAGFNNPTYFTISFKKQFGISPTEYINQLEN